MQMNPNTPVAPFMRFARIIREVSPLKGRDSSVNILDGLHMWLPSRYERESLVGWRPDCLILAYCAVSRMCNGRSSSVVASKDLDCFSGSRII